eukprot:95931_1
MGATQTVSVQIMDGDYSKTFRLNINANERISSIKAKIHNKTGYHPSTIELRDGFSLKADKECFTELEDNKTLNDYKLSHATVYAHIVNYKHEPNVNNCHFMEQNNKNDDEKRSVCPIYLKLKNYQYSENDLEHMQCFIHAKIKPTICRYGEQCKAYKRLVEGGNRLDDRCHVEIYLHPPRVQHKKSNLPKGFHSFVLDVSSDNPHFEVSTTDIKIQEAQKELDLDTKTENELLQLLIEEVNQNGYKQDLTQPNGHSLLEIVDLKLKHPRHIAMKSPLNRAEMLSLILYTGCDCNYDLCKSERNGDYKKW